MTILDSHAHIYPDIIARKAAASIGDFYHFPIRHDGTLDTLLARGDAAGISRFLVHSVAVSPERTESVNNYLMSTVAAHPDRLVGFGSVHPDHADLPGELLRIKTGGLLGVKLHPDIQRFPLDCENALALFRHMAEMGLPLLCHIGDTRYAFSEPTRLARVMDKVPALQVIAAHFGGWSMWTEGWKALAGRPNLWVDSSSSLYALTPEEAASLVRHYGADRVFFASDYPMWDPAEELHRFLALPLTKEEQASILHLNLESFLEGLS